MIEKKLTMICIACAFMLGACGQQEPETPAAEAPPPAEPEAMPEAPAEPAAADLAAILASAARPEEDLARDAGRKPTDVLDFLGVEPGMDVIDLMAAGGWYTEVLSHVVGAEGSVTAQNPGWMLAFRDGFYNTALDERIGDRLTNVTRLNNEWADLATMEAQYDFAMSALNFHDAYYLESPEAAAALASAVYTALRPGGVFGVIDHAGNPDGDNGSLHRIDKALVVEIATAAGFVVEGDSDLLANPDDDHTQGVFSEGIRGQTDRFLLKLVKPAE